MNPETGAGDSFALLASGANFSCEVLQALIERQHAPAMLVLPEYPPARREGQELIVTGSPQRMLQLAGDIDIGYAPAARQTEFAATVRRLGYQFLLIACWPYLIDAQLLASPVKAALNLHPSLLPAYRGADPLRQQLAAGDRRFGISLHLLDQQFDHGDIVACAALKGLPQQVERETLERECARLGVELFIDAVADYPDWNRRAQPG